MKIGLFGGSFDPVHLGHLFVAQAAREEAGVERIFFIPAAQSPFKEDAKPISATQRLLLLRLALAGENDTEIDTQEIDRGGVSFTIDTVRNYSERFPQAQLFYIIGADHLTQLPQWREAKELAQRTQFLVVPRPGETIGKIPAPFTGHVLKGVPLGISSSQIRARVRAGQRFDHLVPTAVGEAIKNNRLYF